ncbi:TPA: WGR domain-containing protein [Legionella pneumophila]|nr:WGR domain-containing protein [Legionella pneumophila]
MQPWLITLPFLRLIDCAPKEQYHAARFEKESRYYVIRLSKDLLGDWVITLVNGRIKSKLGQSRTLAFNNFNKGFDHFCALAKIRHLRGYQLKTITCDNPLLFHLLPFMAHAEDTKNFPATKTKSIHQREQPNKKPEATLRKTLPKTTSQQLGFIF